MLFTLQKPERVAHLFASWRNLETAVLACLNGCVGKVYVTDPDQPKSALAVLGGFAFCAGEPDEALLRDKPYGCNVVPQNDAWAALIESTFPATKKIRYALHPNASFDTDKLRAMVQALPMGYELRRIDDALYDLCAASDDTEDLVAWFGPKESFLSRGRGFVVLHEGRIVSGAASALCYPGGIEIETDTVKAQRHKGLASAVCAALILDCLQDGLYPSWDAANKLSVRLAEKLGYTYSHEYACYWVE